MIVSCPNCSVRFRVGAKALGVQGRRVKCSRCSHVWHQRPEEASGDELEFVAPPHRAPAEPAPPEPQPETDVAPEPRPAQSAAAEAALETADATTVDAPLPPRTAKLPGDITDLEIEERRRGWGTMGVALMFLLVAVVAAGYLARDRIVETYTPAAKLYALIGVPVDVAGAGLELKNLASEIRRENGVPVLVVRGEIINTSKRPQDVPPLRGSLQGTDGAELRSWQFDAPEEKLLEGESVAFETLVEDPPTDATDLSVTFAQE